MDYQQIVNLIFDIIFFLLSLPTLHYVLFAIVGLFSYKKFPKAQKYRKYGVIISARNEEKVIGNLIDSVRKNDYPQDLVTIFVVAHNCTDATAQAARAAGAVVYEYNNSEERTKGYALKYLYERIKQDYGISAFDGFLHLDADNILTENYLQKMNDAFEYYGEKDIITSFRNSKNFSQNLISGMYGIYFGSVGVFDARGRTIFGCSTRVHGTGFLMNSSIMEEGWNYVTLSEDWEFSADHIADGVKVRYCEEAMFYDEQPTSTKIMLRQRLRWVKGALLVFITKFKKLLVSLMGRKCKNKGSVYDMISCVVPYSVVVFFLTIIKYILLSPLFGVPFFGGLPFVEFVKQNYASWLWSLGSIWLLFMVQSAAIFIVERKRIKNMSVWKKIAVCLVSPFFNIIVVPLQLLALFVKVEWKAIPHKEAITIEQLNGEISEPIAENEVACSVSNNRDNNAEISENYRDESVASEVVATDSARKSSEMDSKSE